MQDGSQLSRKIIEDDVTSTYSFEDELKIPGGYRLVKPAVPGSILMKLDPNNKLTSERQMQYCSGTHMMKLTRP